MKSTEFTIKIIKPNPHNEKTQTWRVGQIVTGMEGCNIKKIILALTALEEDTGDAGIGDPARWLAHFAGLESKDSGKQIEPWIEIIYKGNIINSTTDYRKLLKCN
jgi:hypothetical protein